MLFHQNTKIVGNAFIRSAVRRERIYSFRPYIIIFQCITERINAFPTDFHRWLMIAEQSIYLIKNCRSGGNGRHKGLKIPRGLPRAGSSPASGTKIQKRLPWQPFLFKISLNPIFICYVFIGS